VTWQGECHGQPVTHTTNRLGRPVSKSVTARLPAALVRAGKARAARAGVPFSSLLGAALASHLAQTTKEPRHRDK